LIHEWGHGRYSVEVLNGPGLGTGITFCCFLVIKHK
jgi:hypothetical protein